MKFKPLDWEKFLSYLMILLEFFIFNLKNTMIKGNVSNQASKFVCLEINSISF